MATLNEWAYNIRDIARAGIGNSDDERLGIRQIKFWIRGYRAVGIKQQTDFGKSINPQWVSDFGILELKEIDQADASECENIEWGCKTMKVEIPKLVDLPRNRALLFIGKIDKQTAFQKNPANVNRYIEETRFGSNISRFFVVGTTVYVFLSEKDKGLKYINGRGIVEDPTTFKKLKKDDQGECVEVCYDDSKDEYPLSLDLYEFITTSIMQKELGMSLQTVEDILNNAQGEIQAATNTREIRK